MMSRLLVTTAILLPLVVVATTCQDDELDLCDDEPKNPGVKGGSSTGGTGGTTGGGSGGDQETNRAQGASASLIPFIILASAISRKSALVALPFFGASLAEAAGDATPAITTCGDLRNVYKEEGCCGKPEKEIKDFMVIPQETSKMFANNPCDGKKPGLPNVDCFKDNVRQVLEQAGADITEGTNAGEIPTNGSDPQLEMERQPITEPYWKVGLCPVNVHWHLGAEHQSMGEYDDQGTGPEHKAVEDRAGEDSSRRLKTARLGQRCHKFDKNQEMFTKPYVWQHCVDMFIGETYEVHWPHSAAGACGTPWQYQTPFYDGVFCNMVEAGISISGRAEGENKTYNTWQKIGVQGQVFTVVNDETYYYPNLIQGMIVEGEFGQNIAYYTGSTTGTSRNNTVCSSYAPITWQVDRKCHLISASSFDKMCADMKNMADDMEVDLHAHGSRVLVDPELVANNLQRRV